MDYKTLLVHLDVGPRCGERLEFAFRLAEAFEAHLTGLFALSTTRLPANARMDGGDFIQGLLKSQRAEQERESLAAFHVALRRHPAVQAEWRKADDDATDAVLLNARYADLLILGQHDPSATIETGVDPGFVDDVLVAATRPVLLLPYAGRFESIGKRVLVAWNAGPEAARAIANALPLLARAEEVQVTVFSAEQATGAHGDVPGADIALYLARHQAKVSVTENCANEVDIGSRILNHAADFGADLIVMGAYGHSRTRERLFGGATRTLLDSMTAPVLMSH
jgi:nucleotide-binding universal stress UspA family protein